MGIHYSHLRSDLTFNTADFIKFKNGGKHSGQHSEIQSNLVISNLLISNYRLSRSENMVPVLT